MLFARSLFVASFLILVTDAFCASEAICPGGSARRSDISWCADFDSLGSCSLGNELACLTANGLSFISTDFKIKSGDAAVGNGAISGASFPGGTGPGYSNANLPAPTASAGYRFYVKFKDGYLASYWERGNHGPSIEAQGSSCTMRVSMDFNQTANFIVQGSCVPDGVYGLPNNIGNVILKNNRWYMIEVQAIMNTQVNGTGRDSGNGAVRAWIDGTKVLEYTSLNLRGSSDAQFNSMFVARSYYGVGVPSWSQKILYDNFAFSNNGSYIGAAPNENPRGTADELSPYFNFTSYNAMTGKKLAQDCSAPASEGGYTALSYKWRDGTNSYQTAIARGPDGYTDRCGSGPDKALKVNVLSGQGSGMAYSLDAPNTSANYAVHGWLYLPSSSTFGTDITLAGFARYGASGGGSATTWGNQVGVGVVNGKWALMQRKNGSNSNIETAVGATMNSWHEFEVLLNKDNKVSLAIDRNWIVNDQDSAINVGSWAWDNYSGGARNAVIGVMDNRSSNTVEAYFDDIDVGTTSYWGCKGWSAESCPFSSDPQPPTNSTTSTTTTTTLPNVSTTTTTTLPPIPNAPSGISGHLRQ